MKELVTTEKNFLRLSWRRAIVVGASMETIVMLLELKMMVMHVHGGWGAITVGAGCARGEWLGNLGGVLVGWQLWFWSEGLKERGCFLELFEQEEMMKASICFCFFFFLWWLPLVKIGGLVFFFCVLWESEWAGEKSVEKMF